MEAGEAVYNDYCQTCHGANLVNSGQTFDLRKLRKDERARFENSVTFDFARWFWVVASASRIKTKRYAIVCSACKSPMRLEPRRDLTSEYTRGVHMECHQCVSKTDW